MDLVTNLLLNPTVKKFKNPKTSVKVMNEYRVARFYGSRCSRGETRASYIHDKRRTSKKDKIHLS